MMALPNFGHLIDLAKARLLRGLAEKRPREALTDVRQLARLVYSTETLLGSMVAISILRMEREAFEAAVAGRLLRPADWQPLSEELLVRAKRGLYTFQVWLWSGDPSEMPGARLEHPHSRSGACAAIGEAHAQLAYARKFFAPRVLGEKDYGPWLAAMDRLAHSSPGCRLNYVKFFAGRQPQVDSYTAGSLAFMYGEYLPYVRRGVGAHLLWSMAIGPRVYENVKLPVRRVSGVSASAPSN